MTAAQDGQAEYEQSRATEARRFANLLAETLDDENVRLKNLHDVMSADVA